MERSMRSSPPPRPRRRDLIAPIGFLVLMVAMTAVLAFADLVNLRNSRQWVQHSHAVIETTQALFADVLDVESGVRGYMATNDARVLDHFDLAKADARQQMTALSALVADNRAQAARAERLISAARQRISIADLRVNLLRQGRADQARAVAPFAGKAAMDDARAAMADLMDAERRLLDRRGANAERDQWASFIVAVSLSALATVGLALTIISMVFANRRLAFEVRERLAAEQAQRESEARYLAVFANTADYVYVIDVAGDDRFLISDVNPALERAIGATSAQLAGADLGPISLVRDGAPLLGHLRRVVSAGEPVLNRHPVRLPSGERIWESVLVPVRNAAGQVDRIVGSSRDVTEREEAEDRLRRAQRMEAVGHLTGGVAHDFNNLLQVIRGNLELIAPDIEGHELAAQRLRSALRGADRAGQLTRQLLAFARRQPLAPRVINLGRLVTDMAEMLRRTLGEGVEVETVIAGGLWNTLADPAQVESAILNLAINARDAMGPGGRLTIEITNAVLDDTYALRDREIEAGQYVLLAVSDTGHGMSRETAARVFEPFFTTKGEDKGTGLGLSMVYGFVKQSRGHIQIYSEVGQGTTVKIYLPRSHQVEPEVEAPAHGPLRGRSEVILVVEDDELVRASAVGILRDLGYTCLHANDGASALQLIRDGAKIDMLFTDVVMPGPVKSRDLAAEAQRLRPGLPVLFTSGYTDNAIVHHGRLDPGVQLISKPYAKDELARRVRTLLGARRPVVLVVEDEPLVRLAAVDMINAQGYRAVPAADAEAALAVLRGPERIDVLFTDVGLPGMRGPDLAKAAVELRPGLKVVFASGYGDTESDVPDAAQLGKPYDQDQLAEALGAAMA
jgi:PAS domain S-box-containing protein